MLKVRAQTIDNQPCTSVVFIGRPVLASVIGTEGPHNGGLRKGERSGGESSFLEQKSESEGDI